MNTHQLNSTNNLSKMDTKVSSSSDLQQENNPYIQYATEVQELLLTKMEEYEKFRESVKTKLKG
jgi:hypothetical protein